MTKSPTTSLSGGTTPEWDALVATKFHVPRPGFVPRPRLLARLAQGMGHGLTVVCTPAGFGKTTLLADWARRARCPAAWLSLDSGDNDPLRFWRYVGAAMDRVQPGVGAQVAALLRGPQRPPPEAAATAVINALMSESKGDQVALILDDYHLIEAPEVHDSVTFLLDRLPPRLRLMLASRADPPLPLARLRAGGALTEFRAADLRFTLEETAAFLREVTGLDLTRALVATLQDRTEGWAAGVQLAAISLQGSTDPAAFVATFAGSHRYVLDYLTEEVLAHQPQHVVSFLMETSVMDRLCGSLCDFVTGRNDSQEMLEALERANLFLIALDEERHWWRYHHLFAGLLRDRLSHERPERVPELHRAAGLWHEKHGFADDAVRHALAAGETGWAARLVEKYVEGLMRRSEGATLERWLSELPPASARSRPRVCLAQAVSAILASRLELVEPLLADAEHAFAATGPEPYTGSVGRAMSVLANVPASIAFVRAELARLRGDAADATASDQKALAHLAKEDWLLRSQVTWNLAVADWLRGRVPDAEHALARLVAARRTIGEVYLTLRPGYDLGQVQLAQGRLTAAMNTFRSGLEMATEAGRELPPAAIAHAGLAQVLYERNELAAAYEHASKAVTLGRQLAYTQPLATGLALLARIRQAQGDMAGALDAMRQAGEIGLSPQVAPLHNPVPMWRARLLFASGADEADYWADAHEPGPDDQPSYPREAEFLMLARVLIARRAYSQALGLLERLRTLAAAQERTSSVIGVSALQALALAADGDQANAFARLGEALKLAASEGYARVFLDEGMPMARLLGMLASAQRTGQATLPDDIPADYLERLGQAFRPTSAHPAPRTARESGSASLAEPLSSRELEVLRMMAAGKSNQEIADELVVVLATAKKHVSHILEKLGAANRTQAVARARALELLPLGNESRLQVMDIA